MQAALLRRARRWSDRPAALTEALWQVSRQDPLPELLARVLRTLLYAWCTSARFAQPLCSRAGSASASAAIPNNTMRRARRYGLGWGAGSAFAAIRGNRLFVLRETGKSGMQSISSAVILDVALLVVESKRSGSNRSSVALLDARLKEATRRHLERQRAASQGHRGLPPRG